MKKLLRFVFVTAFLLAACSALPQSNVPAPAPQATSSQLQAVATQPQATASQPEATPSQPEATLVPTTAPANVQAAPSLSADEVYAAVSAAWAKLDTAGPRHVSQNSSEGGAVVTTIEADSVPPDFHQVVSAMGNVVAEQYIVGGTIYNNVQGAWTQTAGGSAALSTIGTFSQSLSDSLVYSEGMVNGIEAINGSPAIVYSYSTTLKGLDKSAQYKLWVDQASGLPVRSQNTTPDGMTIDETITYDSSITLSLPAEAKNAPTE